MSAAQLIQVAKVSGFLFAISALWVWLCWAQFHTLLEPGPAPGDPLEAHHWLLAGPQPPALAPTRFPRPADALAFVDRLYRLGATAVYVAGVGAAHRAAGLLIELPERPGARRRLFAEITAEQRRTGLPAEADAGQSHLRIWWDE